MKTTYCLQHKWPSYQTQWRWVPEHESLTEERALELFDKCKIWHQKGKTGLKQRIVKTTVTNEIVKRTK